MAKAITQLKVKNSNGEFTDIPIGIKAENIKLNNGKDLETSVVFLDENSDTTEIDKYKTPLYQEDVVDNLISKSNIVPLSAKQGKILNERINQISNFDGTPSDLEIADLRIGANGQTYNSAGEAVRENFNLVNEDINKKENLNRKIRGKTSGGTYEIASSLAYYPSIEYLEDYYYDASDVDYMIEEAKNSLGTQESEELKDLRKGADGNLYETAGAAVRTNIKELNDDLNQKITLLNLNQIVLFDKDFNILAVSNIKTNTIKEGIFENLTLSNSSKVVYAVIPSSITIIEGNIRLNCPNLEAIYFVNLRENIKINNFSFTNIYFLEEMSQVLNGKEVLPLDIKKALSLLNVFIQIAKLEREKAKKGNKLLGLDENFNILSCGNFTPSIGASHWAPLPLAEKITTIFIPKGVRNIRNNAFKGCPNLVNIYIDEYEEKVLVEENAFVFDNGVNPNIYWNTSINEIAVIMTSLMQKINKDEVYTKSNLKTFLFGTSNVYSTFSELKNNAVFTTPTKAYILGFFSPGDGGAAFYSIDTTGTISLEKSPNFYATLITQPQMNIECFGAKGDGETDDSQILSIASNYNTQIVFGNKTYRIAKPIRIENDINWIGNETIFKIDSDIALDLTSPGEYSEEDWNNLKEDFENYNRGIFNIKGQTKIEGISFKYDCNFTTAKVVENEIVKKEKSGIVVLKIISGKNHYLKNVNIEINNFENIKGEANAIWYDFVVDRPQTGQEIFDKEIHNLYVDNCTISNLTTGHETGTSCLWATGVFDDIVITNSNFTRNFRGDIVTFWANDTTPEIVDGKQTPFNNSDYPDRLFGIENVLVENCKFFASNQKEAGSGAAALQLGASKNFQTGFNKINVKNCLFDIQENFGAPCIAGATDGITINVDHCIFRKDTDQRDLETGELKDITYKRRLLITLLRKAAIMNILNSKISCKYGMIYLSEEDFTKKDGEENVLGNTITCYQNIINSEVSAYSNIFYQIHTSFVNTNFEIFSDYQQYKVSLKSSPSVPSNLLLDKCVLKCVLNNRGTMELTNSKCLYPIYIYSYHKENQNILKNNEITDLFVIKPVLDGISVKSSLLEMENNTFNTIQPAVATYNEDEEETLIMTGITVGDIVEKQVYYNNFNRLEEEELSNKNSLLVRSQSLFKLKNTSFTRDGITISIKNNHIKVTGIPTKQFTELFPLEESLEFFEKGNSYIASCQNCKNNIANTFVNFYLWGTYSSNNDPMVYQTIHFGSQLNNFVKIDTTENRTPGLRWNLNKNQEYDFEFDFMIEENDVMTTFQPYYVFNSEIIKNESVSYSKLNEELQILINNKLQAEYSEGNLTITDDKYTGNMASYQCTKIGNVAHIAISVNCAENQNYISFNGLPYQSSSVTRVAAYSSSNIPIRAAVSGTWINFTSLGKDENNNIISFPAEEKINIHMIYLTK